MLSLTQPLQYMVTDPFRNPEDVPCLVGEQLDAFVCNDGPPGQPLPEVKAAV